MSQLQTSFRGLMVKKAHYLTAFLYLFLAYSGMSQPFITTWNTTQFNTIITIPTKGTGYNYDIDWNNDGVYDELGIKTGTAHDYGAVGIYTIRIRGDFPRIYFNNEGERFKIQKIEQWGSIKWQNMANAFWGCENLTLTAVDVPDLSNVKDMTNMFKDARLFNTNISNWDVSQVTNMENMFWNTGAFNQPIGAWDVSNVTNMAGMFLGAKAFNQDLSKWNVSRVTNFLSFLQGATSFNQDIGNWDVSNATNMANMFYGATAFNQDLSKWDVSNVDNLSSMFGGATAFNQDLGKWNVSKAIMLANMFKEAKSFNQNLGGWNFSNVTYMPDLLYGTGLSIANYDSTLIGWNRQGLSDKNLGSVAFLQYCQGANARKALIARGWKIEGDVRVCANPPFISTWNTRITGLSNNTSISIPTTGTGYNYDVDWNNDGVFDEFGITGSVTHDFGTTGTHSIGIKGDFPRIYFNGEGDLGKIISIDSWGDVKWSSMENAFLGCNNLTISAQDAPDLSNVSSMAGMFREAGVSIPNIGKWDVSKVTDMSAMFRYATSFNDDIGAWDVSNVTNMSNMFRDASAFNQNIGNWNVSNVSNMEFMFNYARRFNQPIGNWDVSNVTTMFRMFAGAGAFNQPIGKWKVSKVTTMKEMFDSAGSFNQAIGDWDVSNVVEMGAMFYNAATFNQPIGNWEVSKVTNMKAMFMNTLAFNQELDAWDVSNVSDMSYMFYGNPVFNQNLNSWNVSKVTNMEEMFGRAKAFNGAIDNWDVSNVKVFSTMFSNTQAFNQPIGKWDLSNATEIHYMFWNATSFNQDISTWKFPKVNSLSYLFSGAKSFNQNISNWDVSNILLMDNLFENSAFNQNLGKWNISKVLTISQMLFNSKLSVANYDSTLIGWDQQGATKKYLGLVTPLKYCKGAMARTSLIRKGWTIQGDAQSCLNATTNLSEDELELYPNPTSGLIYLKGINTGKAIVSDAFGKMLQEKWIMAAPLDISELPAGVYFLQLWTGGKLLVEKIIKQ